LERWRLLLLALLTLLTEGQWWEHHWWRWEDRLLPVLLWPLLLWGRLPLSEAIEHGPRRRLMVNHDRSHR
jgi:hypothetical protein